MILEENFKIISKNAKTISTANLAFLGDAIFELLIREMLIEKTSGNIKSVNNLKVKYVCCTAQAELYGKIKHILTEEEMAIFKRGRNSNIGNVPKNVDNVIYKKATGLEVLFGYLYLNNKIERLNLFLDKFNI